MLSENFKDELKNLDTHAKKLLWTDLTKKIMGFDPIHLKLTHNFWSLILWDEDEIPFLHNDSKLLSKLDKLTSEMLSTDRKTTVRPEQIQLINSSNKRILKYRNKLPNILTNRGMSEMAKRSTGASSSINSQHVIGTGITTETLNDISLETEIGRKAIGSTDVANQTERYGTAFADTDASILPSSITEAGISTTTGPLGILILRVTSDPFILSSGRIFTVQTNVTHQNGTEI